MLFKLFLLPVYAQPMKLIGAGVGRTGTASTREALRILGFKAYHMVESLENNDFPLWADYFEGGRSPAALTAMLAARGYNASLDFPACNIYKAGPHGSIPPRRVG
jgi:hypothetical protein